MRARSCHAIFVALKDLTTRSGPRRPCIKTYCSVSLLYSIDDDSLDLQLENNARNFIFWYCLFPHFQRIQLKMTLIKPVVILKFWIARNAEKNV